jgi:hypothetical protein
LRSTLLLLLIVSFPSAADLPPLRIHAPETMRAAANEIDAMQPGSLETVNRLIGAPASAEPIDVLLASEDSAPAATTPRYISGYANGETSRIVLFPSRANRYPHDGLGELLRHELAHVLIHRASAGRPLPRWFHEGLAVTVSGTWDLEDRARLTAGLWRMEDPSLAAIERGFYASEQEMQRSYAISRGFLRYLLAEFGAETPERILDRVEAGATFDQAFLAVTGRSLPLAEDAFWRSRRMWSRWIPFFTSSIALWMTITFLALWAIRRRRRRDARIRELWELEDELQEHVRSGTNDPKRDDRTH